MIKRYLPKSEFSRSILTLMTGTTFAQAIPVVSSPILSRIYTPEDFGIFASYMAIMAIVAIIATGRLELAIMLPESDEDASNIVALSMTITIVVSLVMLLIVYFFNDLIVRIVKTPEISKWLYFLPISIFLSGAYQNLNYWNNRKKKYLRLASNRVVQSVTTASSQLAIGALVKGLAGLIAGSILSQFIASINLLRHNVREDKKLFQTLNFSRQCILLSRFKNFPKFDIPSALLNIGASQLPNLLLTTLYSPIFAGYFYLTQRVLQMPITLISTSVLDVFKQKATEEYRKGDASRVYKKTCLMLLSMSLPVSVALYLFVDDLFVIVFGEKWKIAGEYAQILIPPLVLRFVTNPLSFMFYVAEKQHWNLIGMLMLLIGVLISFTMFDSPRNTIISLSVVYSLIYISYLLLSAKLANVI